MMYKRPMLCIRPAVCIRNEIRAGVKCVRASVRPCVQYIVEKRLKSASCGRISPVHGDASTPAIGSWRWAEVLLTFKPLVVTFVL